MGNTVDQEYEDFVKTRVKDPAVIAESIRRNPRTAGLLHAVLGISGEAGELVDAVKKAVIYEKGLDIQNVIEELGDLEFYMEMLRQEIGVPRDVIVYYNILKLKKRYPDTYTDQHAIERKDKTDATDYTPVLTQRFTIGKFERKDKTDATDS
jgi:NTP pyrophosphatase (non-canonical NTP hydrolase)